MEYVSKVLQQNDAKLFLYFGLYELKKIVKIALYHFRQTKELL